MLRILYTSKMEIMRGKRAVETALQERLKIEQIYVTHGFGSDVVSTLSVDHVLLWTKRKVLFHFKKLLSSTV